MTEKEWQVLVRGSSDLWRNVPTETAAETLLRDYPEMFVEARWREVSPWQKLEPRLPNQGTGVCYCGADMDTHSGWDNHSPVEMLDWRD